MRHRISFVSFSTVALALAWACNGSVSNPAVGPDASDDAGDDSSVDASGFPEVGSPSDATSNTCKLSNKTDPVSLCVQAQALGAQVTYGYTKGVGFAPGWSSTAPYTALTGHAWQDDLGAAGALGAFLCSAQAYGNNQSTATFGGTLSDLRAPLLAELGTTPPPFQGSYDGEIYFRLRWAQAAYAYVDAPTADALKALAESYGASLAAQVQTIAPSVAPLGDGGDAGGGGDAGDAGDAGGEAGDASPAGSPGGLVIGTPNGDGTVTYAPAQSIMAAAALLDMAALHAADTDGGPSLAYLSSAEQVLAYVLARGKDPASGLFYQSLVTSSDPDHDTPAAAMPSNDAMLTETQAWVMLGLARAQDLIAALKALPDAGFPDGAAGLTDSYWVAAGMLAQALTNAGLFDGTTPPPATPPPGAFLEGLVLSTGELLTNKTITGNAIALGGINRVAQGGGSTVGFEVGELRTAFIQQLPVHSSFFTIVTDPSGNPNQMSYVRAGSRSFGYALAYPEDAGVEATGARDYRADAISAMVEGFSQLWIGAPNDVRCAP